VAAQKEVRMQESETGRILLFPARVLLRKGGARLKDVGQAGAQPAVEDLRKYEEDAEPDDYARRMIINVAAFAFIVVLTLTGIWLAEQMASLRKHQDCAMAGRKNCADIETLVRDH
jgi:hypothetical protein